MERTFSGYCRTIDAARIIFCEQESGGNGDRSIGCDYACCVHRDNCPIAGEIEKFLQQTEDI